MKRQKPFTIEPPKDNVVCECFSNRTRGLGDYLDDLVEKGDIEEGIRTLFSEYGCGDILSGAVLSYKSEPEAMRTVACSLATEMRQLSAQKHAEAFLDERVLGMTNHYNGKLLADVIYFTTNGYHKEGLVDVMAEGLSHENVIDSLKKVPISAPVHILSRMLEHVMFAGENPMPKLSGFIQRYVDALTNEECVKAYNKCSDDQIKLLVREFDFIVRYSDGDRKAMVISTAKRFNDGEMILSKREI